jgi:hypothetical protein
VADINDRLERLNRREEFARRAYHGLLPPTPDVELDDDFVEVLVAVARVVQRHPGLSVMVAAADGRPGRTVMRVSERSGGVETAVVPPPQPPVPPPARNGNAPVEPVRRWAQERVPERAAGNGGRHSDERFREPPAPPPGYPPQPYPSPAAYPPPAYSPPAYQDEADPAPPPPGPGPTPPGLVTLTDETSQVVARLAQMLREDPSLASGWVRERSP